MQGIRPDLWHLQLVLPALLWIEIKSPTEEEDSGSEVFKSSVSSRDGFDFLYFSIDAFGLAIGWLMTKSIAHALIVSFKHLGDLGYLLDGFPFHTFKPYPSWQSDLRWFLHLFDWVSRIHTEFVT